MDLTVRTENYVLDNRDWLDSEHGTDATIPVTLDVAQFVAGTHYPNGFIKSGAAVGLITATNLYGPYSDAALDGRQTLVGHLYDQVKVAAGATKLGATLLRHGFIKRNHVPYTGAAGGIDTAGETDVKGLIGYRTA